MNIASSIEVRIATAENLIPNLPTYILPNTIKLDPLPVSIVNVHLFLNVFEALFFVYLQLKVKIVLLWCMIETMSSGISSDFSVYLNSYAKFIY